MKYIEVHTLDFFVSRPPNSGPYYYLTPFENVIIFNKIKNLLKENKIEFKIKKNKCIHLNGNDFFIKNVQPQQAIGTPKSVIIDNLD